MKYGFVYCLGNESFPNLYKIDAIDARQLSAEEIPHGTGFHLLIG